MMKAESFRILYVDPPWHYNDRKAVRKDNSQGLTRFGIGAQGHYGAGCMTDQELADLAPLIGSVSAPDAYLFMWATSPRLESALALGQAWGFRYVTQAFVWVKTTRNGLPFYGTGAYTGSNVEPILLLRRGGSGVRCWHPNGGGAFKPGQVILAPHPTDQDGKKIHSRKPAVVREHLEKWLGDVARLELFATERAAGWVVPGAFAFGIRHSRRTRATWRGYWEVGGNPVNANYDIKACVEDILDLEVQKARCSASISERKKEARSNGVGSKALNLALRLMRDEKLARDMAWGEAQEILREVGADPIDIDLFERSKNESE